MINPVSDSGLNSTSAQFAELRDMNNAMFEKLHQATKEHWAQQHHINKDDLEKILQSRYEDILVHDHSVKKLPQGRAERIYLTHTIELCIVTDPHLFTKIQVVYHYQADVSPPLISL